MSDSEKQNEQKPKPQKVNVDPRAISAHVLHIQGVSQKDIAAAYGVTTRTVQRWQADLRENHNDMVYPAVEALSKRLQGLAPKALDRLEDFLEKYQMHENASQVMKAIENVLKTLDVVKDKSTVKLDVTDMTDSELLEALADLKKNRNE